MKKRILPILLSILLFGCSFYMLYHLIQLNLLPNRFLMILVVVFVVFDLVLAVLLFLFHRSLFSKILWTLLCVVLSLAFVFGGYNMAKTSSMFSSITNLSDVSAHTVSVFAKDSSSLEDVSDLDGKTVGTMDAGGTDECLKGLKKENVNVEETDYSTLSDLLNALYTEEVDAIVLNEANRDAATGISEYSNFDSFTKVIYQTTYKTKNNNKANSVDDITSQAFNVLITGSDSRVSVQENSRSDVNMIMTINPKTHTVLLTSIPRDYYVTTVCDASDGCMDGEKDKLTHTGIRGVNTTKRTIEELLDIEINYTVKVGFETLTQIVDAIGGIDVNVPSDYASSSIGISAGLQHMDGETALKFARERYSYSSGDRQRTKNQQLVLISIVNKLISADTLKNYASLMDALSDTFITNMSSEEIQKLIQFQIDKHPSWTFEQYMLDGTGDTLMCAELGQEASVMVPDQSTVGTATQKIKAVLNGRSSE